MTTKAIIRTKPPKNRLRRPLMLKVKRPDILTVKLSGQKVPQKQFEVIPLESVQLGRNPHPNLARLAREIAMSRLLTPQEELELALKKKKAKSKELRDQAKETMIKCNLRLVLKIAYEYEGYGLPILDLFSEGSIGLTKAVERYDPYKGAKLSTYAAWWIKQAIRRALSNQCKTIRLPIHVVDKLFRIKSIAIKLIDILGREPTMDELSDECGIPVWKIEKLLTANQTPASLSQPLGFENEEGTFGEVIEDPAAENASSIHENRDTIEKLRQLMSDLSLREFDILCMRFGLNGNNETTLEDVGIKLGVTRERIRQIQNVALAKLRRSFEKIEGSAREKILCHFKKISEN